MSGAAGARAPAWLIALGRFGRGLFSLAVIGVGVETLVCVYGSGHGLGPHHKVVPVIPWPPAVPGLDYALGVIWIACGLGLLFRRTVAWSAITFGALMVLCGAAFDGPRGADLMNPEWRTNLLEPIALGCMAWLGFGWDGVPGWLQRVARYLLALALVVFGIAHFQVLAFIAAMVPGWIPWHSFWTVFSGIAFVAAGLSFAVGRLERWAALGLGLMFAIWLVTIHLPAVLHGAPSDPDKWSDVLIVAALWGGSWAMALALRERK